jgi:hypothetical protein
MKIITTIFFLIISLSYAEAQIINAVTSEGDEVILYTNGTWEYVTEPVEVKPEIRTNPSVLTKAESSTFLVKSKKIDVGVWINPKTWSFEKTEEDAAAEYTFQKKGEDVYGMLLTERTAIPLLTLRDIALENARGVAPDIRLVDEEYRNVNGLQVLMLQMTGTIQGIEFTYFGYYYSDQNGTVQFVTYTALNLFNDYKADMEKILNGLVTIDM